MMGLQTWHHLNLVALWLSAMSKSLDYVCKTWDNTADYSKGWQWWQKPTVYYPTSHWCQSMKINWHHSKSTSTGHLLPKGRGIQKEQQSAGDVSVQFQDSGQNQTPYLGLMALIYLQSITVFEKMKKIINLGPAWVASILRLCFGKLEASPVTYELYRQQQLKC